ncbi:MAG: septum formation protein Maf [Simkaniaceae bacterium]|nr:MAG: septum formation protein Maf [Simkaniaceae bacterium]
MRVILGSQSPRRREILEYFSLPFVVAPSDFDEKTLNFNGNVEAFVQVSAQEKGKALLKAFPDDVIITADTVVYFEGKIFQKPEDDAIAFEMLKMLSGKTHEVVSGVAVRKGEKMDSGVERTPVTFNKVGDREIHAYLKVSHGRDKAGAYGIQECGSLLVKGIEGSFYNVVGLPVNLLHQKLKLFGIDLWDALSS